MPYKGALLLRRGPAPQQWQHSGPIWVRRALDKCTRGETDPQKRCPLVPGPSEAKKRPQTATLLRLGNSHPIYVGDSHPGIHHPLPPLSSSFLIYPPLKSSLSAFPPPSPIFTPLPNLYPPCSPLPAPFPPDLPPPPHISAPSNLGPPALRPGPLSLSAG